MAIQIIITGDHATDALAELKTLAEALSPVDTNNMYHKKVDVEGINQAIDSINNEQLSEGSVGGLVAPDEQPDAVKVEKPKRTRKPKAEPTLDTQPAVEVEKVAVEKVEAIVDSLMDDEDELVITADSFRALISKVGKDKDGKDDREKYAKINKIVRDAIPAGKPVMVSNIPADKLKEVYYEVAAI